MADKGTIGFISFIGAWGSCEARNVVNPLTIQGTVVVGTDISSSAKVHLYKTKDFLLTGMMTYVTRPDSAGVYRFTDFGPGRYTIVAEDAAFAYRSKAAHVQIYKPEFTSAQYVGQSMVAGSTMPSPLLSDGGSAPITYTVASGALPPGVTLNANGTFSGVVGGSVSATYTGTFVATDSLGNVSVPQAFSIHTTALAAKAWRIFIAASNSSPNYGSTQELEMRETVGGANRCTGGTPFASTISTGYTAALAFDGNKTAAVAPECWAANGSEPTPFLGYILPTVKLINQIEITARHVTPAQSPMTFTIQSSTDTTTGLDGTWWDEWTVTGQTGWAAGESRAFTRP